jgi:hypothetical protein
VSSASTKTRAPALVANEVGLRESR